MEDKHTFNQSLINGLVNASKISFSLIKKFEYLVKKDLGKKSFVLTKL